MKNGYYSIEDQNKIGKALAEMLKLRKDKSHKDRYSTTWGSKTCIGIFNTIARLGQEIREGTIEKTLNV